MRRLKPYTKKAYRGPNLWWATKLGEISFRLVHFVALAKMKQGSKVELYVVLTNMPLSFLVVVQYRALRVGWTKALFFVPLLFVRTFIRPSTKKVWLFGFKLLFRSGWYV